MSDAYIGLGGVIIGAGLTLFMDWVKRHGSRKRRARYLAVRVICIFDGFVDECSRVVTDGGVSDGKGGFFYDADDPNHLIFPNDLDWKSIDEILVYEVFSVENEINKIRGTVSWHGVYTSTQHDRNDRDIAQKSYAELGVSVNKLASKFRKKYSIPEREELHTWGGISIKALEAHLEVLSSREKPE